MPDFPTVHDAEALAGAAAAVIEERGRTGTALTPDEIDLLLALALKRGDNEARRRTLAAWARRRERVAGHSVDLHTVGTAVTLGIASALITELAGVHALFGAFLAGAIVPRESGLADAIAERLEGAVGTALLPVVFAYTGVRTDIGLVTGAGLWMVFAVILTAAIAGKLGASAAAARSSLARRAPISH